MFVSQQYQPQNTNVMFSLIDVNEIQLEQKQQRTYLYKINENTTVLELNNYLKRSVDQNPDSNTDYVFFFNNKDIYYEGSELAKVFDLIQPSRQQVIVFAKKPQNAQNTKKYPFRVQGQSPEVIKNHSGYYDEKQKNYSKISTNPENNHKSKEVSNKNQQLMNYGGQELAQMKNNSQFTRQENEQQKNRTNYNYVQMPQNQNFEKEQQLIETQIDKIYQQVLSKCQARFDDLYQQINSLQNKDNDKEIKLQKLFTNILTAQNYNENQQLKHLDLVKINIQQQIDEMNNKIVAQNKQINIFQEKIDNQLLKLYQDIQNINRLSPLRKSNTNSLSQSNIYNTQTEFNLANSLLQSEINIKLSCYHQIEKQKLEQAVQNAIFQGQEINCQTCKQKVKTSIIRQLGHVGDQYLQVQYNLQLHQLYQNLIQNYRLQKQKKQVVKCNTNNCNFFCIFDFYDTRNYYFCPLCLAFSVYIIPITQTDGYSYQKRQFYYS